MTQNPPFLCLRLSCQDKCSWKVSTQDTMFHQSYKKFKSVKLTCMHVNLRVSDVTNRITKENICLYVKIISAVICKIYRKYEISMQVDQFVIVARSLG